MKILSKKPFIADGIVLIPLIIATFAYPPISLKNPWIIFCLIFLFLITQGNHGFSCFLLGYEAFLKPLPRSDGYALLLR